MALDDVIVRAVNVIILHTCNCESGEISIVPYLLGGGAQLEVALDDVIVRAVNVIIIHTCSCSPSGIGRTAGGGTG